MLLGFGAAFDCVRRIERERHDLCVDKCPDEHGIYLERGELAKALEITDEQH